MFGNASNKNVNEEYTLNLSVDNININITLACARQGLDYDNREGEADNKERKITPCFSFSAV